MKLFPHRHAPQEEPAARPDDLQRPIPDPSQVPTARGTWEEAALVNVDVTEFVKRQIGTVTRPWHK